MSFLDNVKAAARKVKKTIVLPESMDPRVVEAAAKILEEQLAEIILLGKKEDIQAQAPEWDVSGATFIDPANYEGLDDFSETFYEMRKQKGITPEKARETMLQPTPFGIMMVKKDLADGLVAGAVGSTADTLRPALQILRTKPGTKMVSTFFMMVVPDCEYGDNGTFLFSDCGLVENPDADQLSEIAVSSATSFKALTGVEPKVAMLSYSSFGSAKSEWTEKVVEATRLAKEKAPQFIIDGELQADAAIVPSIGKSKAPDSKVQGDANCLIFPDLNAGNIGYKLVERLAKAEAYGPMLQGIAKPVNDLSRGCSADDIVGVTALTVLQCAAND